MYASIFPILISGYSWAPLSISYPQNKIKEITKQIKPVLIISDKFLLKKINNLKYKKTIFEKINSEYLYNKKYK